MSVRTIVKRNLNLINQLRMIDNSYVRVGFIGEPAKEQKLVQIDGVEHTSMSMTVQDIATIHEFGAPSVGIPERAPIRTTVKKKARNIAAVQKQLLDLVLKEKMKLPEALERLGLFIVGETKMTIREGLQPALEAATVRAKGGKTTPLIDTGQLINSVTHQVKIFKDPLHGNAVEELKPKGGKK